MALHVGSGASRRHPGLPRAPIELAEHGCGVTDRRETYSPVWDPASDPRWGTSSRSGLAKATPSLGGDPQGSSRLAAGPTRAYAVAKGLINQAAGVERLDYQLDQELENLARIADGRDFAEGLDAFFSRRPPRFEET